MHMHAYIFPQSSLPCEMCGAYIDVDVYIYIDAYIDVRYVYT